jgi:hypothetical protein
MRSGLRGEQFQDREDARRQVIFEVEHADEFGPIEQRQAENGPDSALTDMGIHAKRGLGRGIVQNNNLAGTRDVMQHRLGQHALGHSLVDQTYGHGIATGRSFRLDTRLLPARQNQQRSLGTCLRERVHNSGGPEIWLGPSHGARRTVRSLRHFPEACFRSTVRKGRSSGLCRADRSWDILVHAGS